MKIGKTGLYLRIRREEGGVRLLVLEFGIGKAWSVTLILYFDLTIDKVEGGNVVWTNFRRID